MEVQVSLIEVNPEYSQQYADEYHFGKESENNSKSKWGHIDNLQNVKSISLHDDEQFLFKGQFETGQDFEYLIPDVLIFRCQLKDGGKREYVVSKSILKNTHQARNEKYDVTRFYFYLNPEPEWVPLATNLCVDLKDVPKELIEV
jgi:hypothetical protein